MKKKETPEPQKSEKNSLRTFLLFCLAVGLLILGSLCYKTFLLVKNSKFDGQSGFVLLAQENDNKKAVFYAFDPHQRTLTQLTVTSNSKLPNLRQTLALPVDGEIKQRNVADEAGFPFSITSYSLYRQQGQQDISVFDAFRFWWLSHTIPEGKKHLVHLKLPSTDEAKDQAIGDSFIDSQLEIDKKTITIVNGTLISGLGSRLERSLSRAGANVISVTTAHEQIPRSRIIYYSPRTYTVNRLTHLLPYPLEEREGTALSDIIIEIGEDSQRTDLF